METYCVSTKKNTANENLSVRKTKQNILMLLSNYAACGQKNRGTGNLKHLYRNKLDISCFANDAAHADSKDLAKRIISNKILKDKAYEITRNCGYDGYQKILASMVYKFFW